ncbi:MAG TPA: class I SAM-dependent methyltransferase [Deltaproteobacteria bacterium]|nr:class I SAM-dependent methyltransferase [Deltaproteobacteria bacterium]
MKKNYWNRIKARWYRRGLEYSNFAQTVLTKILPLTEECRSFLDVGAGCGTLSIPLARAGKRVTALDPSPHMIEILKEDMKRLGIKNIRPIVAEWGERKIPPHDVVICANVPELLKGSERFPLEANSLARKFVFLITSAGPEQDKFYYKELYPLLFNKPFNKREDYLKTYTTLHSLGIFANVEIIEYDFDQPFKDMDEAVEFWKEYLGIVTEEFDEKLRAFLSKRLEPIQDGLLARFHKRSAIIWWRKVGGLKAV